MLTVADLADGDRDLGGDDLGLAVAEGHDDGGSDDGGADDLPIGDLARERRVGTAARHGDDLDGRALGRPVAVVEVVEIARGALVEDGRAAERHRVVAAHGEARRVDGAGLRGSVKLELVVGGDVAGSGFGVGEHATGQAHDQGAVCGTTIAFLRSWSALSHNFWTRNQLGMRI